MEAEIPCAKCKKLFERESLEQKLCGGTFCLEDRGTADWRLADVFLYAAEIRIGVQSAKAHGHVAAGISCLDSVIDLEYEGTIRVVYQDECAPKLQDLLKGFREDQDSQMLKYRGRLVHFVSVSAFKDGEKQLNVIGIVAAADHELDEWRDRLKCDLVLVLQPYDWGERKIVANMFGFEEVILPMSSLSTYQIRKDWKAISSPQRHGGNLEEFVCSQQSTKFTARHVCGMLSLLTQMEGRRLLALPVYGLHWYDAWWSEEHGEFVLQNLVGAAMMLSQQLAHQLDDDAPPIAICVFGEAKSTTEENLSRVRSMFDDAGVEVKLVDLQDISTELESGCVHVVKCGFAPPDLFRYFLSESRLPAFLEGANSTNLAHMLGIPYLSLRHTRQTDYPSIRGRVPMRPSGFISSSECRLILVSLSEFLARPDIGLATDNELVDILMSDIDTDVTIGRAAKHVAQLLKNLETAGKTCEWGLRRAALLLIRRKLEGMNWQGLLKLDPKLAKMLLADFVRLILDMVTRRARWWCLAEFMFSTVMEHGWVKSYFALVGERARSNENNQVYQGLVLYHSALEQRRDFAYMEKVRQILEDHARQEVLERLKQLRELARRGNRAPLMLTWK